MKRLLKRRGRSICSLLAVFLMVFSLMPAQAVSADEIDATFSITGLFFSLERNESYTGTVTVGETCPICKIGTLYGSWYEADVFKAHYIQCAECQGYIKEVCTSDATCTREGTCTVCGVSYKADHDWIWVNPQAATCTSVGYTQRCLYCRTCGDYFDDSINLLNKEDVEIPITHSWGDWEDAGDGEHHTRSCENGCGTVETKEHTGGEATFTNGPFCEVCGLEYDKPLSGYSDWFYNETLGLWFRYIANDTVVGIDIHDDNDHFGGTATCKDRPVCDVCGQAYDEINPDNHLGPFEDMEKIEPTCMTPGREAGKKCTACGQFSEGGKEIPINKDAHDWGDWVTVTEPEVGKAGEQKRTCKREGCNESETKEVPALIGYTASISGDGNWTKGSTDSLIVTVNRSEDDENCISHYVETLIDGEAAAVTAEAGSTVVTVSPEILEKLGVGTHTVTVHFDDGNVEANLTVNEAEQKKDEPAVPAPTAEPTPAAPPATPDTGDENSLQPWSILMAGTAVCLVSVIISAKRSRVRKH